MADEKETKKEEFKDLDSEKDPKGGATLRQVEPGRSGRGEQPRYTGG